MSVENAQFFKGLSVALNKPKILNEKYLLFHFQTHLLTYYLLGTCMVWISSTSFCWLLAPKNTTILRYLLCVLCFVLYSHTMVRLYYHLSSFPDKRPSSKSVSQGNLMLQISQAGVRLACFKADSPTTAVWSLQS